MVGSNLKDIESEILLQDNQRHFVSQRLAFMADLNKENSSLKESPEDLEPQPISEKFAHPLAKKISWKILPIEHIQDEDKKIKLSYSTNKIVLNFSQKSKNVQSQKKSLKELGVSPYPKKKFAKDSDTFLMNFIFMPAIMFICLLIFITVTPISETYFNLIVLFMVTSISTFFLIIIFLDIKRKSHFSHYTSSKVSEINGVSRKKRKSQNPYKVHKKRFIKKNLRAIQILENSDNKKRTTSIFQINFVYKSSNRLNLCNLTSDTNCQELAQKLHRSLNIPIWDMSRDSDL